MNETNERVLVDGGRGWNPPPFHGFIIVVRSLFVVYMFVKKKMESNSAPVSVDGWFSIRKRVGGDKFWNDAGVNGSGGLPRTVDIEVS